MVKFRDIERLFGRKKKHGDGGTRRILGIIRVKDIAKTVGGYHSDRILGIRKKDYEKFVGGRGSGKVFGIPQGGLIIGVALAIAFSQYQLIPSLLMSSGASLDAHADASKKKHDVIEKIKKHLEQTNDYINSQEISLTQELKSQSEQVVSEFLNSKEKAEAIYELIITATTAILDNNYTNFIMCEDILDEETQILFKAHFHDYMHRMISQDESVLLSDEFISWKNRVEREIYEIDATAPAADGAVTFTKMSLR
jgi:hypothetical protein